LIQPKGDLRDTDTLIAGLRNRSQGYRQPHFRLEDTLWIQTVSISAANRRPKDTDSLIQCSLEEAIEIQTAHCSPSGNLRHRYRQPLEA
jgi:hypothetical protein